MHMPEVDAVLLWSALTQLDPNRDWDINSIFAGLHSGTRHYMNNNAANGECANASGGSDGVQV